MTPQVETIIKSFVEGIVFLFSAYLLRYPPNKFVKEQKILYLFWVSAGATFLTNTIQMIFFVGGMFNISLMLIKIMVFFMTLQMCLAVCFVIPQVIKRQFFIIILVGPLIVFSLWEFFSYLIHARYQIVFGEPRAILPNQPLASYLTSIFLLVLLVFVFRIFYQNLRLGFFWTNLALLYRLSAVSIYGMIAFLRTLYFLPRPWYLNIFYFLIPILHYLAFKEELKNI